MSVFVIDATAERAIIAAADRARATPIPLAVVKRMALAPKAIVSGERPANVQKPQIVDLPHGWRLNISCEEQLCGLMLHLSMSSPTPQATVPRAQSMAMVLNTLGYDAAATPAEAWLEEFLEDGRPGGKALNVLVPAWPQQVGHA